MIAVGSVGGESRRDCLRRRANAQTRIIARAEQRLVELRAAAMAYSRDDELCLIDTFLLGFEKALRRAA